MKVDRPKIMNTTDSTTQDATASEPVQPEKSPAPKTDTVEMKTNSFYNFDQAKLDPAKTNVSPGETPKTFIPPFREKVEIAKTLPNGQPVDGGLGSDPTGKTWTGPNRMGVDMNGINVRNQLDDALKLRQGSQSTSPSGDGNYQPVTAGDLGSHGKTGLGKGLNIQTQMDKVAAEKDNRSPGQRILDTVADAGKNLIEAAKNVTVKDVVEAVPKAVDKIVDYAKDVGVQKFTPPFMLSGEASQLLDAPSKVKEVTGDEKDLVRGIAAAVYPESRLDKIYDQSDENKYVNPEADSSAPQVTDESLKKVQIRKGANTTPTNEEMSAVAIDPSKLTAPEQFGNPKLQTVADPRVGDENTITPGSPESLEVRRDATGPETVDPDDTL